MSKAKIIEASSLPPPKEPCVDIGSIKYFEEMNDAEISKKEKSLRNEVNDLESQYLQITKYSKHANRLVSQAIQEKTKILHKKFNPDDANHIYRLYNLPQITQQEIDQLKFETQKIDDRTKHMQQSINAK